MVVDWFYMRVGIREITQWLKYFLCYCDCEDFFSDTQDSYEEATCVTRVLESQNSYSALEDIEMKKLKGSASLVNCQSFLSKQPLWSMLMTALSPCAWIHLN